MEIPDKMRAMVLVEPGKPLQAMQLSVPRPGPGQILLRVRTCGVCRTDLHILDGELAHPSCPRSRPRDCGAVARVGAGVERFRLGDRVGVPGWVAHAASAATVARARKTCATMPVHRLHGDGGYAEYTLADQQYCFHLPSEYDDAQAAPLLCAGLIGYRSYRMAGERVERLGIYGFGAAAHIIAQVAVHQGSKSMRSPGRRCRRSSVCTPFGRSLGRRFDSTAARRAGRGDHLCAGRRAPPARCAPPPKAVSSSAAAFT